ncbi:MAG: hypothetical protein ACR2MS_07145 [Weeksellaceae bacterium]
MDYAAQGGTENLGKFGQNYLKASKFLGKAYNRNWYCLFFMEGL